MAFRSNLEVSCINNYVHPVKWAKSPSAVPFIVAASGSISFSDSWGAPTVLKKEEKK
ncbi:hypothetical protein SO802_001538 [Lithocarpus litseifolius]|uniref:Uncharacterized protein n=1 Tax=Lithocarpus litseifolius TaxID=425828 RepID=A0AAW2DYG3_9ROSI